MNTPFDSLLLLAQIDRQRDELRTAEEEVAQLADKVSRKSGTEEDLRRIGEKERRAGELKTPLAKAVARLRTSAPQVFQDWADRNRQALQGTILKGMLLERPEIKTVEEGLARIAQDGKYSNGDLEALRLSGYLEEWTQLLANKRPYALYPASWDAWPPATPGTIALGNPLPIPVTLAARHPDITGLADWKPWHQGLIFFAEALSILDQGKPVTFSRETGVKSPSGEWQSSWTLSTGSLTLVSRWGERSREPPAGLEAFSATEVQGLLPGEKLDWEGSLGSDSARLIVHWAGLREDRRRALESLARLLFGEVGLSTAPAAGAASVAPATPPTSGEPT